jgi:hypothetical protein
MTNTVAYKYSKLIGSGKKFYKTENHYSPIFATLQAEKSIKTCSMANVTKLFTAVCPWQAIPA